MKKAYRVLILVLVVVLLAQAAIIPAFAADITRPVPVEQTAQEINGKQVLTRVYVSEGELDPETLIEKSLTVDGFDYDFVSIVQSVEKTSEDKQVSQKEVRTAAADNLGDTIKLFDSEILFDDGEYSGKLHLDPKSVITTITATEQVGGTTEKSATKVYSFDYNDPTLVPQSITENGYTMQLQNVTWKEGEYREDSSVPVQYTATATYGYSHTSYKEVPSEYTTEVTYTGTVTKPGIPVYTYTLTYSGTPVTADHSAMIAGFLRGAIIAAAIAAAIVLIVLLVLRILSMFAKVQVQDPTTGEYRKIQTVRLRQKAPLIKLDVLKLPEATHYLVSMRESCARRMRGKIILVQTGTETIQHKVEAIYGKRYVFDVDLEPVM